jgi:hypothetical protein
MYDILLVTMNESSEDLFHDNCGLVLIHARRIVGNLLKKFTTRAKLHH